MDSLPSAGFPTTDWSRVARAGDPADMEARVALSQLCESYWYPIYALIRRLGHPESDALDLAQEYFARLLEKPVLSGADRTKGRFRAFLRADCRFFLNGCHDRARAQKRGGGCLPRSIDARDAEGRYLVELVDSLTPNRLFDRAWALTLLGRALDRLADEYSATGRADVFEALRPTLVDQHGAAPHSEMAARLGLSVAAVQKAASRLRKRYREVLRDEIAATLDDPSEDAVAAEIRDLFDALGP
jgi:RNA polymerase sigma-70 factor (ECF subfamily)